MIILDTNVLSETLRPSPDARALAWLEAQPRAALFTTTITQAEVLYGVRVLPNGQRKAALLDAVQAIFVSDMAGQVLGFDSDAAAAYDAMIAAEAKSRGAGLATRNVKDFADCGIQVVDPWQY